MADRLAGGNQAIALLANTLATGAILVVIITILGPVSGAHFNPAVTLVMAMRGATPSGRGRALCRRAMRGRHHRHHCGPPDVRPCAAADRHDRARPDLSQWLAEAVATFTMVLAILGGVRYAPHKAIPWLVGLVITAAYWFTASTSFANPAVTLARGSPRPSPALPSTTSRASSWPRR